jgi:hypothetical protein
MRKLLTWLLPVGAAAALFLGAETNAHAGEVALGAGIGVDVPFNARGGNAGVDFDALLGYRLHLGPAWFLQPEAVGGYRSFGSGFSLGRLGFGAHFGFGRLIQPQVYAHVGAAFGDASGFNFDGGGAIDLHVSVVFVGAHAGFNVLSASAAPGDNTLQWLDLGIHAGLLL